MGAYIASPKINLSSTAVDHSPYVNEGGLVATTWYSGVITFGTSGQPTFCGTTAPPAAGALTSAILVSSTAALGVYWGVGAPTVAAAKGSLYIRTNGSTTNDRAYIASDGVGGWTALTTAA